MSAYDRWLEAPYQRRAASAEAEEREWEKRGIDPDDLNAPHSVGSPCPRCADDRLVDCEGTLVCDGCGEDIDPDERPTFSMSEWLQEEAEAAAEAAAEARWEEARLGY